MTVKNKQEEGLSAVTPKLITPTIVDNILAFEAARGGTIVKVLEPIDNSNSPVTVTVQVTSLAKTRVGDKLVMFFKVSNPGNLTQNTVTIRVPYDTFYSTQCGQPTDQLGITRMDSVCILFWFDGEKFLNTTDNC